MKDLSYYRKRTITLFLFVFFVFFSCVEDSRMHNMVNDSIYIKDSQLNQITVFNWGEFNYELVVVKSGVDQQSADVELIVNEEYLSEFNKSNGIDFSLLPQEYYKIVSNKIAFSKDDYIKNFEISFNSSDLSFLIETTGKKYAIPCQILLSNTTITPAFPNALYSVIVPEIKEPYIGFDKVGLIQPPILLNPASNNVVSGSSLVKINYPNRFGEIPFEIVVDPELLDDYNANINSKLPIINEKAYRLLKHSWLIPANRVENYALIEIIRDGFIKDGVYQFGDYILPLRLVSVDRFDINPEQNSQLIHISFQPQNIDRTNWKVIDASSEEPTDGGNKDAVLDGSSETYWHSQWRQVQAPLPHYLVIDMGKIYNFMAIEIERRLENTDTKVVKFELSLDGKTFTEVGEVDFGPAKSESGATMFVSIVPTNARYLKCIVTESNRPPSASIAEIHVKGLEIMQ